MKRAWTPLHQTEFNCAQHHNLQDDDDDDDDFDDDLEKGAVALIERVRKISEGDEPDPFQKGRRMDAINFATEEMYRKSE